MKFKQYDEEGIRIKQHRTKKTSKGRASKYPGRAIRQNRTNWRNVNGQWRRLDKK